MTRLLTLLIPCLTLAAFVELAVISYHRYPPPKAVTSAEKRAMASKKPSLVVTLWSRFIPRMNTAAEMVARAHSDIQLVEAKTPCGDDFGCWMRRE